MGISSFSLLRSSIGFGPLSNDRKSEQTIIESDDSFFVAASLKGKSKRSKFNEWNKDSYFYRITDNVQVFGVADGHGPKGHNVSQHIVHQLSDYLKQINLENSTNPSEYLNEMMNFIVDDLDQRAEIESKRSGSTLIFSLIDSDDDMLYTVNIGNSRAIICYRDGDNLLSKQLNVEHSPSVKAERDRIYANGGYVDIWGFVTHSNTPNGLRLSRSIGDDDLHFADIVSSKCDISEHQITERDVCIVCATDGVFDMMKDFEVAHIIKRNLPNLKQAAIDIVNECEWKWRLRTYHGRVDDITITILAL